MWEVLVKVNWDVIRELKQSSPQCCSFVGVSFVARETAFNKVFECVLKLANGRN